MGYLLFRLSVYGQRNQEFKWIAFYLTHHYLCPTEALAELINLCFSSLSFPNNWLYSSLQNWPTVDCRKLLSPWNIKAHIKIRKKVGNNNNCLLCWVYLCFASMHWWLGKLNGNKAILFVYSSIHYNQYWPGCGQTQNNSSSSIQYLSVLSLHEYCASNLGFVVIVPWLNFINYDCSLRIWF